MTAFSSSSMAKWQNLTNPPLCWARGIKLSSSAHIQDERVRKENIDTKLNTIKEGFRKKVDFKGRSAGWLGR